jgi:hypothetical protein
MITLNKGAKIKCKKCNKLYDITIEDFGEFEETSDERSMGYETQYSWIYEQDCEKCSNSLEMTIDGYEYPSGILNYQEFNVEGCLIIEEPSLEVISQDEDY